MKTRWKAFEMSQVQLRGYFGLKFQGRFIVYLGLKQFDNFVIYFVYQTERPKTFIRWKLLYSQRRSAFHR